MDETRFAVSAVRSVTPATGATPLSGFPDGWRTQENRNQVRTRDLNEATERTSGALTSDAGRERFACECGDIGCTAVICLTKAEYEAVRAYPTHFAIVRNHENPEREFVIHENDRWAIVETVGKEAIMAARGSDPRSYKALRASPFLDRKGRQE